MRELIAYVFCTLCMVCLDSAVSWNCQDCNRQSMQHVQNIGQLGLVCVLVLGRKCSFPNNHFLDSGRKK